MSSLARSPEIVLVRHGRSAHVEPGWINVDGLRRWAVAYDAAEISLHDPPPAALIELARSAGCILASDLPRAVASAAALAPGRPVQAVALLREAPLETAELPLLRLGGIRLPLRVWGLIFGLRWFFAWVRGRHAPGIDAAALARAEEAAALLTKLAAEQGRIIAVTHGIFRGLLASALARRQWRRAGGRPFRNWSGWVFRPR